MKITDIQMYTVEIPLLTLAQGGIAPYVGNGDDQAGTVGGTVKALSNIFKIQTDEGIVGWGEMNPVMSMGINRMFLDEFIRPALQGQDPFHIKQILARFASVYNPQINAKSFFAGVEIACWDIMGKASGQPVCSLLGGPRRDKVKVAYCLGMLDLQQTREKAAQIVAAGFGCIKSKGGTNVRADIERTWAIRQAAGDDLELRMDVNQGYDMAAALEYLDAVEGAHLQYIEQPLPINRFADMQALRRRTKVPLAINEDCYLPGNVYEMVRQGAIDAAVVDLEQLGGIGGLADLAAFAEEAGLPLAHHCGFDMGLKTAAIVHASCALPALRYAADSTYATHADDILATPIQIEKGHLLLPQGPGLGVQVDEEKLAHYALESCTRKFL